MTLTPEESIVLEFKEGNCKRCDKVLHRFRFDDYCQDCSYIIERERKEVMKQEHLASLATMSIEDRLAIIEKWMYEHKENHPRKEVVFK